MATLNGTNYKKAYVDVPSVKIGPGEQFGDLHVAYEDYDLATLGEIVANGDVILGPKLPAGARPVQAILQSPSMGATGIFDLGWQANGVDAADQNGLVDQADAGGQAVTKLATDTAGGPAGLFKKFSVETQLVITCTEDTVNTTGTIKAVVFYVVN